MRITAKEFTSADLYLGSAITILLQSQPRFSVENGKTLCVFPVSDGLYKALSDCNSGVAVNALEFAQTIKRLRSEMLLRKDLAMMGWSMSNLPLLNPIAKHFLHRYKERLFDMLGPEVTRIVDCIDCIPEAVEETRRG